MIAIYLEKDSENKITEENLDTESGRNENLFIQHYPERKTLNPGKADYSREIKQYEECQLWTLVAWV